MPRTMDCPRCSFPMREVGLNLMECRSCQYQAPQNNREETYEIPRDQYFEQLKERYDEGRCGGLLTGCLISITAATVVMILFMANILNTTNEILIRAQERQRLDTAILERGK